MGMIKYSISLFKSMERLHDISEFDKHALTYPPPSWSSNPAYYKWPHSY